MGEAADSIASVCTLLERDDLERARSLLRLECPDGPLPSPPTAPAAEDSPQRTRVAEPDERRYGTPDALRLFLRDGFVDRYSGARLVFPPVLRWISQLLPDALPFHPNWKVGSGHRLYWEIVPTVDHIVPVILGGKDDPENEVTTLMLRNMWKSDRPLERLGWTLHPAGDLRDWDGLTRWMLRHVRARPESATGNGIGPWVSAARRLGLEP